MDETRKDSLMKHVTSGIHDVACAKHLQSLFFVLPLIVLRGNRLAYGWCCTGRGAKRPACIRPDTMGAAGGAARKQGCAVWSELSTTTPS